MVFDLNIQLSLLLFVCLILRLKAANDDKLTGCVIVDFRKAFDLVDHKILYNKYILYNKLKCYKCDKNCLSWFESCLSNRTQCVSLNNKLSTTASVKCGVPPGSILGPLLCLIFINDLPLVLQDYVVVDLYADDTTFYDLQFDVFQLETNLQHALFASYLVPTERHGFKY